jgi:hypothetical protein
MARDLAGWKKIKQVNNATVYRRPNDFSNFDSIKAEMYLDLPPTTVSEYLWENLETI